MRKVDDREPGVLTAPPARLDRLALFLDLDGVLAPLAPTPDAVKASARRTALLERLAKALDGRLAIISGRTLDEIDRISGAPFLAASGVHGLQARSVDGNIRVAAASPAIAHALAAVRGFAEQHPALLVEEKGVAIGLHYRSAPDLGPAVIEFAETLAHDTGLSLQPGDMIVELKTPGADKGTALTAFMQEPPFRGGAPVMLGDDLTDEYAFRAARALGGQGVLVGPPRDTAAIWRLDGVEAVLDWLDRVCDAQGEEVAA